MDIRFRCAISIHIFLALPLTFNLSGAMGSYAAFYLAGMYPLPATGQILLSSPYFPQISFYNPVFNTTTTIIAKGFKGNPSSGTGGTVFVKVRGFCFVLSFPSGLISLTDQSVTINGKLWKSNCYLDWDTFRNGSTVELELTDDIKVSCGKEADALPLSLPTGGY